MSSLLTLPLFQGLTKEQLMNLLEKAIPEFISVTDEPILRRGDRHDRILLILKGRVTRSYTGPSRCTLRELLCEGDIIEFTSLFGKSTRVLADYSAEGEVCLLAFDKRYMFTVFNRFDIIQLNMLNLYCAHAQALHSKLTAAVGNSLASRFCHLVDTLSDNSYGPKQLIVPRTRLAELFGCSRRPMSAQIVAWENAGLVKVAYGQILIPDLSHLRQVLMAKE